MSLIAAICTNRTPPAVQPALAAVCEQVTGAGDCSALLVISGLDESAAALHAESAARLGARAVRAPAGLSLARNRALEEAQDADLIAFVDDDTLPQDGWLEALLERWRRASPQVACIGGAILPRWQRPPPAWVGRGLDEAFSLLDLGPGLVELDPLHGHDAWGANISFRAGRVREVGGFDAGRGAWSGVPLFGDESAVQRRLAERGYRVLYAGDVRVEHLIGAERLRLRQLWRRELYRGASAAIDGRASAWGGAALAAKAAAGMLIAALRGDRTLAAERLARLARSSGAACSPLIRRRLRRRGWPGA